MAGLLGLTILDSATDDPHFGFSRLYTTAAEVETGSFKLLPYGFDTGYEGMIYYTIMKSIDTKTNWVSVVVEPRPVAP